MIRIAFSLFATGIALGAGPCMATCGPVLLSYITATKKGPANAFRCWFIFSITRAFIYASLGALTGIIGTSLYQSYYWEKKGFIIWAIGGIFICLLGILTAMGNNTHSKVCHKLQNIFIAKDTKSIMALGVVIGLFPCAPLIGVLSYISMISVYWHQGVVLAFSFGLGTIISPLLILGLGAGLLQRLKVLQDEKTHVWFGRIAGVILFFLGLHILIKTIVGYLKAA
ncbi:MAG: sulfite exporter TauE/SafE family protein [Candidatus Omnitrophota bacterium]